MGHVIILGLNIISTGRMPNYSEEFRKQLQVLKNLKTNTDITDWERLHIKATELLAEG